MILGLGELYTFWNMIVGNVRTRNSKGLDINYSYYKDMFINTDNENQYFNFHPFMNSVKILCI